MLSPNDQVYSEFIHSTVIQVFESLPAYLQKSVFFYYNVEDKDNPDDIGLYTLTLAITSQIKALLDQQIIKNAETIELQGPSSEPVLKAVNKLANMVSGKTFTPKTPDASTPEVLG
jgi:hypothetical protein